MDGKEGENRRYTSNKRRTFQRAIDNHEKVQNKTVIGPEKDEPMEISAMLISHWVIIKNPLSIMKNI